MSVRLRRLRADYEQIKQSLRDHPAIAVRGASGTPPDRYQIEYRLRSLVETADGQIQERTQHVAEVFLTLSYPRQAPQCRMLTPVYHPNIAPHAICIGDHWAAGESLLQLIIRIGEMLAFQSYNTKSPLNGAAARWVKQHLAMLPTDARDLTPSLWLAGKGPDTAQAAQCDNCASQGVELLQCSEGHRTCVECRATCCVCGNDTCLLCQHARCHQCRQLVCEACRRACVGCGAILCTTHSVVCSSCGAGGCADCFSSCAVCNRLLCPQHALACTMCGSPLCAADVRRCQSCGAILCAAHLSDSEGRCGECASKQQQEAVIRHRCTGCSKHLKIRPEHAGMKLVCPYCGVSFTLGQPEARAPEGSGETRQLTGFD